MKEYPCKVCGETMNISMCQSGIVIEGVIHPAHVDCADHWGATEIDVFKITSPGNGSYYEEFEENVFEAIREMSDGSEYLIKKEKMNQAKYHALPEFNGF